MLPHVASRLHLALAGVLACSWLTCGAKAADEYFSRSWLVDDGLPTTEANDVVQDHDGFLWVATPGGLARFDGVQFKLFTSPLIAKAAARNIRALETTPQGGVLMLPAIGGLVEMTRGRFRTHPATTGLEDRQLRDIFVEQDGTIWLEIEGGWIRRWHEGQVKDFGPDDGLNERAMATFAQAADGDVWVASGGFVARYEGGELHPITGDPRYFGVVTSSASGGVWVCKGTVLRKLEGEERREISADLPWVAVGGVVRVMYEDHDGALWIGTAAQGLYRWSEDQFTHVEVTRGEITAITQDMEGSLWVTSEGSGLTRLRPKNFELYDTRAGLPLDDSDSVSADSQGTVWVANRDRGVARISADQAEGVSFPEGSHRLRAYAICADARGGVWVSEDGLYRFDVEPPHSLTTVSELRSQIHALYASRRGDMWVGGEEGLLGHYVDSRWDSFVPAAGFPGKGIRCIAEDVSGRIWVGTETGKLFRQEDGRFGEFGPSEGLPEAPIRALYADGAGNIWIGTIGGGLVLARDGKFTSFTVEDGLPNDDIAAVLEDDHGRLWFGSRGGIFYVAKADIEAYTRGALPRVNVVTFGRNEGLYGASCVGSVQPMACKTGDGRLWFATRQGVLVLDPGRLNIIQQPPPVFIDEVVVNNREQPIEDPMVIPPQCRRLEFRIAALSFVAPEKVRLRYLLEGEDLDWTEIIDRREVSYTGLHPGRYRMRVQASNQDGVWSGGEASLAFMVQPTWWQLRWVRASAVVLAATGFGLGVRRWSHRRLTRKLERLEQEQALEHERARIARDLHDDLGATVTQVGLMVEELAHTPPERGAWHGRASEISGQVRRLARDLDAVVWSVNPGNDSLSSLSGYLSHFFLETLRCSATRPRLQVEEDFSDAPLKPEIRHHLFLIVKEAVNNVIKHSHATEATLGIAMHKGRFELWVQDNGHGFDLDTAARSARNGLRNMRARASEMGCTFDVSSQPGEGTIVRVRLPVMPDAGARG